MPIRQNSPTVKDDTMNLHNIAKNNIDVYLALSLSVVIHFLILYAFGVFSPDPGKLYREAILVDFAMMQEGGGGSRHIREPGRMKGGEGAGQNAKRTGRGNGQNDAADRVADRNIETENSSASGASSRVSAPVRAQTC